MKLANAEHLTLGDYIQIKGPSLEEVILPVVDIRHIVSETIESYVTVGSTERTMKDLIKSIS